MDTQKYIREHLLVYADNNFATMRPRDLKPLPMTSRNKPLLFNSDNFLSPRANTLLARKKGRSTTHMIKANVHCKNSSSKTTDFIDTVKEDVTMAMITEDYFEENDDVD